LLGEGEQRSDVPLKSNPHGKLKERRWEEAKEGGRGV
jgi:hypothetical protein